MSFFEKPHAQKEEIVPLFLKAKDISAQGYEEAGGFVVQAGAQVVKDESASIHNYLSRLRKVLLSKGLLEDDGTVYRLTQDYPFASPSTASAVLLGQNRNGRTDWKDRNGRSLKKIQEAATESP